MPSRTRTGRWSSCPRRSSPGEHALTLQAAPAGAGAGVSSPSVKVVVPKSGKGAVAVARAAPEQAGAAHADAGAAKPNSGVSSDAPPPKSAPAVAIRSAEAEAGGSFFATGSAPAGSQSRLYLNGAFIGRVIADLNGLWSLKVEKGMQPGHYVVRADEVEPSSGKVIARAEVPFDFPVSLPPAPSVGSSDRIVSSSPQAPKPQIPSKAQPPAEVAASARPVAERSRSSRSFRRCRRKGASDHHRRARRQPLADQPENARARHSLYPDLRGQCEARSATRAWSSPDRSSCCRTIQAEARSR